MKATRQISGFSRLELLVLVVIVVALLTMLASAMQQSKGKSARIACVNNLKQIGVIVRVWEDDGTLPLVNAAADRWKEALAGTNAGPDCWAYYAMFGAAASPNFTCPSDERPPATNSEVLKDDSHLSYFVGVQASDKAPQSILGGDRNLGPGNVPDLNYGFSPGNGRGNDVLVAGPACWSVKMHSEGSRAGAGNILLGDGSCQQVTTSSLDFAWLKPALQQAKGQKEPTNSAAIRLVFP